MCNNSTACNNGGKQKNSETFLVTAYVQFLTKRVTTLLVVSLSLNWTSSSYTDNIYVKLQLVNRALEWCKHFQYSIKRRSAEKLKSKCCVAIHFVWDCTLCMSPTCSVSNKLHINPSERNLRCFSVYYPPECSSSFVIRYRLLKVTRNICGAFGFNM